MTKTITNMWEITDSRGTRYAGTEENIRIIYDHILEGRINEKWTGSLKLVQVHQIHILPPKPVNDENQ